MEDNWLEVRHEGKIFWISQPKPDIDFRTMVAGFEVYVRMIGAASYAPTRKWAPTGGQAIAKAMERITGIGYE